jgi:hypothetical protein
MPASSLGAGKREGAERAKEWLLPQERDCRSFAVREFDAYQEAEKIRHQQMIEDVLNVKY